MRVWPEVSGGGVGHRARRNRNSWRHASTRGVDGALVIPSYAFAARATRPWGASHPGVDRVYVFFPGVWGDIALGVVTSLQRVFFEVWVCCLYCPSSP